MTSWIELTGRHAAASMLHLTGHLRAYGPANPQEFDFWSGPGGCWRIERAGDLVYLGNHDGAATQNADGTMQHVPGQFHIVHLGTFSPKQILGLNSLLFTGMSDKMAPATAPAETEFAGRKAWTTTLTQSDGTASVETIVDDETGVLVGLRPTAGPWLIQVSRLAVHSRLDEALFDWRSVANDIPRHAVDNSPEAVLAERIAILEALAVALDKRTHILDVIAESADAESARSDVAQLLGIPQAHATAVLDMQLRRFVIQERTRIRGELNELTDLPRNPPALDN